MWWRSGGCGGGDVQWASYHHHVSGERVRQVCDGGAAIGVRGVALGAVTWLIAPAGNRESRLIQKRKPESLTPTPRRESVRARSREYLKSTTSPTSLLVELETTYEKLLI